MGGDTASQAYYGSLLYYVGHIVLGILTMIFAAGLHRGLAPSRAGIVGPVALFISGAANVLGAIVPRAGESAADGMAPRHEYCHIIEGQVHLSIDGLALDLIESHLAIVRGGMSRQIHAVARARMVLARE